MNESEMEEISENKKKIKSKTIRKNKYNQRLWTKFSDELDEIFPNILEKTKLISKLKSTVHKRYLKRLLNDQLNFFRTSIQIDKDIHRYRNLMVPKQKIILTCIDPYNRSLRFCIPFRIQSIKWNDNINSHSESKLESFEPKLNDQNDIEIFNIVLASDINNYNYKEVKDELETKQIIPSSCLTSVANTFIDSCIKLVTSKSFILSGKKSTPELYQSNHYPYLFPFTISLITLKNQYDNQYDNIYNINLKKNDNDINNNIFKNQYSFHLSEDLAHMPKILQSFSFIGMINEIVLLIYNYYWDFDLENIKKFNPPYSFTYFVPLL